MTTISTNESSFRSLIVERIVESQAEPIAGNNKVVEQLPGIRFHIPYDEEQTKSLRKPGDGFANLPEIKSHTELIPIDKLEISVNQTRIFGSLDRELLQTLALSIRLHGLIEKPQVRAHPNKQKAEQGVYEIITGHRRLSAIKSFLPLIKDVECTVLEVNDEIEVLAIAGESNLLRSNLSVYEEGRLYRRAAVNHGLHAEAIAKMFSVSPDIVRRRISLARSTSDQLELLEKPECEDMMFRNNVAKNMSESKLKILLATEDNQTRVGVMKLIAQNATSSEIANLLIQKSRKLEPANYIAFKQQQKNPIGPKPRGDPPTVQLDVTVTEADENRKETITYEDRLATLERCLKVLEELESSSSISKDARDALSCSSQS